MYTFEVTINALPKRYNENKNAHWAVKHKEMKMWRGFVHVEMLKREQRPPLEPLAKATLELIRRSSVEPDFDNLVQSFKVVVDALTKLKIIQDDKMSVIGQPKYKWQKAPPGRGSVTIRVRG